MTAVIEVALTTVTLVAATPPIVTVAPVVKPVPVSVTAVPPAAGPDAGLIAVTVGAATNVKPFGEAAALAIQVGHDDVDGPGRMRGRDGRDRGRAHHDTTASPRRRRS